VPEVANGIGTSTQDNPGFCWFGRIGAFFAKGLSRDRLEPNATVAGDAECEPDLSISEMDRSDAIGKSDHGAV
jgi:hypothetical protein